MAVSNREFARMSGMTRERVDALSKLTSWNSVTVGEAVQFMDACGVDILSARRQREFIRRKNWQHWERAGNKKYFANLMRILYESRRVHPVS